MLNKQKLNKKAMSIIEVMIAIFIFTLWLSSVFMIISSAGNINTYNKDFIIASNLAREQVELIRNIRDTNYIKFQKWNMLRPESWNYNTVFSSSTTQLYKFENWNWIWDFHIKSSTWAYVSDFRNALKDNTNIIKEEYRLCLENNKYVYCNWTFWEKKTPFYKFMKIEELKNPDNSSIENSFKINSSVWWNKKWIHKIEIPSILADYKRL